MSEHSEPLDSVRSGRSLGISNTVLRIIDVAMICPHQAHYVKFKPFTWRICLEAWRESMRAL